MFSIHLTLKRIIMIKIRAFDLSVGGWLLRFYLMMIALLLGFAGLLWLAVPVALLFAISCIMGVSIKWVKPENH